MSPSAAIAKGSSPLYSNIKGKQDNPGASDGNKRITVRYWESGTLSNDCKGNLSTSTYKIRLNPSARIGMNIIVGSKSIFNKAMNIVAGSAKLKIRVFMPS